MNIVTALNIKTRCEGIWLWRWRLYSGCYTAHRMSCVDRTVWDWEVPSVSEGRHYLLTDGEGLIQTHIQEPDILVVTGWEWKTDNIISFLETTTSDCWSFSFFNLNLVSSLFTQQHAYRELSHELEPRPLSWWRHRLMEPMGSVPLHVQGYSQYQLQEALIALNVLKHMLYMLGEPGSIP